MNLYSYIENIPFDINTYELIKILYFNIYNQYVKAYTYTYRIKSGGFGNENK